MGRTLHIISVKGKDTVPKSVSERTKKNRPIGRSFLVLSDTLGKVIKLLEYDIFYTINNVDTSFNFIFNLIPDFIMIE